MKVMTSEMTLLAGYRETCGLVRPSRGSGGQGHTHTQRVRDTAVNLRGWGVGRWGG